MNGDDMQMRLTQHGSHLDHMLKQTRNHHVQLSSMADVKANMLITLGSLVITFTLRYTTDPLFRWPAIILIVFCFATIVTAAYAAMPKVDLKTKPNLKSASFNPLFFGSFMNLDYDEYRDVMNDLLDHPDSVYELQVREVYQMGVFLGRKKYRFIRYSYLLFLLGLSISSIVLIMTELSIISGG